MSRSFPLAMLAALVPAAAGPAQKVGEPAPEITWLTTRHFDGFKNQKLSELRGSAVLIDFFEHHVRECEVRLPKLQALHETMFDRGLVVVILTFGEDKELDDYFAKEQITCPIATAAFTGYEPKTLPFTVLIDVDGKVVWADISGNFDSKLIEPLLAKARPANLAAGLEEVGKLASAGKLGASYAKAKELLAGGTLSEEAKAQAEKRIATAEANVAAGITAADAALAEGDCYRAFTALDPLGPYAGVPRADEAAQKLATLLADKKQKREVDAGKALAEVEALARRREYDEAFKGYKKVVSAWSNTRAAAAANAAALAIQKGGKLGFDRGCGACMAADKTCSLHAKKKK